MKKALFSLALVSIVNFSKAQTPAWTTKTTGAPALHFVNVLKAVDANNLWFSDTAASAATDTGKYIGLSTDGGTTWTNKVVTGPAAGGATIGDIHPVSASTAWIITCPPAGGTASQNGVWKTTDAGSTWTKQTSAAFSTAISFANVVYFWDANNGFAAGDPFGTGANKRFEMYTTTNGGTNWTNLGTGVAPAPLNGEEYGYTSKITVVGDNIWLGTDLGRLLYSPNRGGSWQAFQTQVVDFGGVTVTDFTADMAFKDANNGLIVEDQAGVGILYSTADKGATTSIITPNGAFYPNNIAYVPGTANTYVTSGFSDGSSYSNDGGLNWTEIASDPETPGKYYGSLQFLSPTVGFSGGASQAAIGGLNLPSFSVLSGSVNLAVAEANANKLKLSVFPNPVSEVLNLKSDKEITGVTVIDLSGKIIKREKGASQINVSNLAKGTYVVQAAYKNGSVENTKFIKK